MKNPWVIWFLVSMVLAASYIHAICVAWVSRNSSSIRSRSVCSAVCDSLGQLSGIAANNIYRADDRPLYHRGNFQLFIISVASVPSLLLVKAYYVGRNKSRDKIWNAMTPEEREDYVRYTKDEGNKRLEFRFHQRGFARRENSQAVDWSSNVFDCSITRESQVKKRYEAPRAHPMSQSKSSLESQSTHDSRQQNTELNCVISIREEPEFATVFTPYFFHTYVPRIISPLVRLMHR